MTLILTVNGPETIWVLSDRRISYRYLPPKEDGRKVMFLYTTDAKAILAYSGLGATALGTEPVDWTRAVLRSRDLSLEQSLGALTEAMKKQFPPHMVKEKHMSGHQFVVSAFVGGEVRLYSIDLAFSPDRKTYGFRYTRHAMETTILLGRLKPQRLGLAGTGGVFLDKHGGDWLRGLRSVIKAYDRGRASMFAVADYLAHLNDYVHRNVNSVGPRCIVVWQERPGGIHQAGVNLQGYTRINRDAGYPPVPTIDRGGDMSAWATEFLRHRPGTPGFSSLAERLNRLPVDPDENLR